MRLVKAAGLIIGLAGVAFGGPIGPPGGSPILNQNFPQVGAQMSIASGSVSGQLTVGSIVTSTLAVNALTASTFNGNSYPNTPATAGNCVGGTGPSQLGYVQCLSSGVTVGTLAPLAIYNGGSANTGVAVTTPTSGVNIDSNVLTVTLQGAATAYVHAGPQLPLLNANNTWTHTNLFSGAVTLSSAPSITATVITAASQTVAGPFVVSGSSPALMQSSYTAPTTPGFTYNFALDNDGGLDPNPRIVFSHNGNMFSNSSSSHTYYLEETVNNGIGHFDFNQFIYPNTRIAKLFDFQFADTTGVPRHGTFTVDDTERLNTVLFGNGSFYSGLTAPASPNNTVWTLPVNDGSSGQCLATDGAKNLSFVTVAGGAGSGGYAMQPATVTPTMPLGLVVSTLTVNGIGAGQISLTTGNSGAVQSVSTFTVVCWGDANTNTLMCNPVGTSSFTVTMSSTSNGPGHLAVWGSNGFTLVDGGTSTTGSGGSGAATLPLPSGDTSYVQNSTVLQPATFYVTTAEAQDLYLGNAASFGGLLIASGSLVTSDGTDLNYVNQILNVNQQTIQNGRNHIDLVLQSTVPTSRPFLQIKGINAVNEEFYDTGVSSPDFGGRYRIGADSDSFSIDGRKTDNTDYTSLVHIYREGDPLSATNSSEMLLQSSMSLCFANYANTFVECLRPNTSLASNLTFSLPLDHGPGWLHDDGSGALAWTIPAGGGGGSSSLAVTAGVSRSSPTSDVIFNPNQFTGSVSGSSMAVALNGSSVTLQGPIVSSITAGSVYPGALTAGIYSNITGVGTLTSSVTITATAGLLVTSTVTAGAIRVTPTANSTMTFVVTNAAGTPISWIDTTPAGPTDFLFNVSSANGTGVFQVNNSGALLMSTDAGLLGQVLVSSGTNAPTDWSDAIGNPSRPMTVLGPLVGNYGISVATETVTYNLNAGSMTGAGLSACGSTSQALSWASGTNQFGCTTITAGGLGALTGNQSITWTGSGDVSGSASGATSISPTLTAAANQPNIVTLNASSVTVKNSLQVGTTLYLQGAVYHATTTVTATSYQIQNGVEVVYASSTLVTPGSVTYTLPVSSNSCTATGCQTVDIIKVDTTSGTVVIKTAVPTDLIDGTTGQWTLNAIGQSCQLIASASGGGWWPFGHGCEATPSSFPNGMLNNITSCALNANNDIMVFPVYFPAPTVVQNVLWGTGATTTGVYDFGIYDMNGKLLTHVAGGAGVTNPSASVKITSLLTQVNLPPGWYQEALTGSVTTLLFYGNATATSGPFNVGKVAGGSSTGVLPATLGTATAATIGKGNCGMEILVAGGSTL